VTGLWRRHWRDYITMVETCALAMTIEIALKVVPLSRLLSYLDRLGTRRMAQPASPLPRLRRFAAAAYRLSPVEGHCLRESLVYYALLRRRGAAARFCLGVAKEGRQLTAHAWVECAGDCDVPDSFSPLLPAALHH